LTGQEESIRPLTEAVDSITPTTRRATSTPASGIMVLTPQGKIARYLYGISYSPRDVRLALVEASQEKIGTPVDAVLLYCFHYDATTGRYNANVMSFVRLGGGLMVAAMAGFFVVMAGARGGGPATRLQHPLEPMGPGFSLFPERASTGAEQVDALMAFMVAVSVAMSLLIAVLLVYFTVKYRRRPGTSSRPSLRDAQAGNPLDGGFR